MTVFVSHSFQDKPEFDNVVDVLEQREVPYWNPAEVQAGSSLREQLRAAVDRCDVCIFVATKHSVDSSWCGAELGAFWGAGKPIIVYLAEASMTDGELPPIVQGDVYERRLAHIAKRAKDVLEQLGPVTERTLHKTRAVGQLTVEQLEKLIAGAVSLAAATTKDGSGPTSFQSVENAARRVAGSVLSGFRTTEAITNEAVNDWDTKILWVDDRPDNNIYERQALESMGLQFTLALSTQEALHCLAKERFAAIISDMGRKEGPREGYVLLEAVREKDQSTPFYIYAGSRSPKHQREAASRGAQGTTNIAEELVNMVVQGLPAQPKSIRRTNP